MPNHTHPKRRRKVAAATATPADRAAVLDRLADAELQHGHLAAAEHLAWRAATLRERKPCAAGVNP